MDIGLIYSQNDPRQKKAYDFVKQFVKDRGMLAHLVCEERPVDSPTFIINGFTIKEERTIPREDSDKMFPSVDDIARILDEHIWCL